MQGANGPESTCSNASPCNARAKNLDAPPRKVVVGACCTSLWGPYPGLAARIERLGGLIDRMSEQARARYASGLDLAVLPETAVSPLPKTPISESALPLDGEVLEGFAAIARRNACYVLVPLFLAETPLTADAAHPAGSYSNAAVLIDRQGRPAGIYRKLHPVMGRGAAILEGGVTPGVEAPAFACDFGRVGVQICYDMSYDDGWEALAAAGAELVVWPTMSPGISRASSRALRGEYFVLSSTWRNNASLFDPTGERIAAVDADEEILVAEIDLEYRLLTWQPALRKGQALDEAFGERVGYRYSEAEDMGIFWSNDPATPIGRMAEQLDLETKAQVESRSLRLQNALRPSARE